MEKATKGEWLKTNHHLKGNMREIDINKQLRRQVKLREQVNRTSL